MAKKVKSDTIQSIKKGLRMLPLIGKLVGKPKESKSKSKYKPPSLRKLPLVRRYSDDSPLIHKDKTHIGDYHFEINVGRDPEKSLGLPSAKTWIQKPVTPGQTHPEKSIGRVGQKDRPHSEKYFYNEYKSPLFKYRTKSSQKEIRRRLKSYKTPLIESSPYFESIEKKSDNSDLKRILKNKPKV